MKNKGKYHFGQMVQYKGAQAVVIKVNPGGFYGIASERFMYCQVYHDQISPCESDSSGKPGPTKEGGLEADSAVPCIQRHSPK